SRRAPRSEVAMPVARAVRFTAPRRVEVVPVEVAAPGSGQLLVRVRRSGISSGTELLAYRGQLDPDMARDEQLGSLGGTFRYPFGYGYSCVGLVEQGSFDIPDGTAVFAFHPHQELIVVDGRDMIALPPQLDAGRATLFPLMETALQISLDC